jgi:holo-[acyl-carrier protein] synthase
MPYAIFRTMRHASGSSVGFDLVDTTRFMGLGEPQNAHFLRKLFTPYEISYGLNRADYAPHFAGIFAAKEAASKALGTREHHYLMLEIRHTPEGAPEVWQGSTRVPVAVSISHEGALAGAVAFAL